MARRFARALAGLAGAATLVVGGGVGAPPAAADGPSSTDWAGLLPPLPGQPDTTASRMCPGGELACVDRVLEEMRTRYDGLQAACDHDAVFSFAYLRTTEEYRRAVVQPGFFADPAHVNHEDVVFNEYYARAYDHWHRGTRSIVPPAWRLAFAAADDEAVVGTGDMLLGISAHINRDLPFVLAEIGLTDEQGASRKPDHDRVNHFLIRVAFLAEAAQRLDPTMDDGDIPGTSLDERAVFQLIVAWREEAWRNAERLVAAQGTARFPTVVASIEQAAAAEGQLLATAYDYGPGGTTSARDATCAAWNDGPK